MAGRRARVTAAEATGRLTEAERLAAVLNTLPFPLGAGHTVAVYAPMASEPDVSMFSLSLLESGVRVAYPNMEFLTEPGTFPFFAAPASEPVDRIDVVIVPAIGLDLSGVRLGRGGGWYDRAIEYLLQTQQVAPLLVGVCYDSELHKSGHIPTEPHDISVDYIATPSRLISVEVPDR